MAKAKQGSTALAKWDAELAKAAQASRSVVKDIGSGGNFISLSGGRMKYKGAEVPGNKMNCIVLAHMLANLYYDGAYDPDNPQPPVCYAFGVDEDGTTLAAEEMVPHEKSGERQNPQCHDCVQNQWPDKARKAAGERGKPCKNTGRLALVTEGDMEDVENAEVAYLQPPVTSMKAWAGYVRQCADVLNKPPFAVVTEISLVPDPKTQFRLQFELVQPIEDGDAIGALIVLNQKVQKEIAFPFPDVVDIKPAPAARKAAPRGKVVAPVAAAARGRVAVGARAAKY